MNQPQPEKLPEPVVELTIPEAIEAGLVEVVVTEPEPFFRKPQLASLIQGLPESLTIFDIIKLVNQSCRVPDGAKTSVETMVGNRYSTYSLGEIVVQLRANGFHMETIKPTRGKPVFQYRRTPVATV